MGVNLSLAARLQRLRNNLVWNALYIYGVLVCMCLLYLGEVGHVYDL